MEISALRALHGAITPITLNNPISSLQPMFPARETDDAAADGSSFGNMLRDAMAAVNQTADETRVDSVGLAGGFVNDSLHNIEINAVKAELALQTLISVRGKVIDAYTEIMRINL
jgi:flagellar hook-basal body complex protein FliE